MKGFPLWLIAGSSSNITIHSLDNSKRVLFFNFLSSPLINLDLFKCDDIEKCHKKLWRCVTWKKRAWREKVRKKGDNNNNIKNKILLFSFHLYLIFIIHLYDSTLTSIIEMYMRRIEVLSTHTHSKLLKLM